MATCDPRDIDPAYTQTIDGPATLMSVSSPNTVVAEGGPYQIYDNKGYQNSVSFICQGEEMLRCGPDGFFVRGKKVDQDDNEAQIVYNSFKEWLTWQQLNRG
jgi:hypothetical protein